MIAFGILLVLGGIQWSIQSSRMVDLRWLPDIMITEDFNLTMPPVRGYGSWGGDSTLFPAIMGIVGGIVWVACGIVFAGTSFPGTIWMATGIMLVPIGALNFLRGLFFNELWRHRAVYPSTILRFLFVERPKLSIFIFAAAAFVCIVIGIVIEKALEASAKKT